MIAPRPARRAPAIALAFALAASSGPRARADDFDSIGTGTAPVQTLPAADTPPPESATASVVRVVALQSPRLEGALPCSNGLAIGRGTLAEATGLLVDAGRHVLVPAELASQGVAFAIQRGAPAELVVAEVVHVDALRGVAVLRLFTPIAGAAPASVEAVGIGDTLTSIARDPAGAIVSERARVEVANGEGLRSIAVDRARTTPGRVLFRAGQLAAYMPTMPADAGRGTRDALAPSGIDAVVREALALATPALDATASMLLSHATLTELSLASAASDDERCAALAPLATLPEDVLAALDPASLGRPSARVAVALALWNRAALGGVPEEEASRLPTRLVESAQAADSGIAARAPFAATLHQRELDRQTAAVAQERERERREAAARAAEEERERVAAAAIARQEERDRRPISYHVGAGASFARDGSTGLGGGLVTGGFYASLPRLPRTGSVRVAAALGVSAGMGGDSRFLGFLAFDVGATLRLGGTHGAYLLLAYSPGVVSAALQPSASFAASGYRASVGMTLGRRVVTFGYRVMAPANEFALHLLEVGVAFRHGPPPPRPAREETSVASR